MLDQSIDEFLKIFKNIDSIIKYLCENNNIHNFNQICIYEFNNQKLDNYQKKLLKEKFEFPKDLEFKARLINSFLKNYKYMILQRLFIKRLNFRRIFNSIIFRFNSLVNKFFKYLIRFKFLYFLCLT